MSTYRPFVIGGGLLIVAASSYLYFNMPEGTASRQWTDDAYIQADYTNVSSRVPGTIDRVLVEDNQRVEKGDTLALLDDRDFRVAAEHATAAVSAAESAVATTKAQIVRQGSLISESRATIEADNATLELARSNESRNRQLSRSGSATVQALEQAQATLATAVATRDSHAASLEAARAQLDVLKAEVQRAIASLAQATAALDDAKLKLSYTKITAPISGVIGQKALRTGSFVPAGTTLVSIVPMDRIYIRANYRETQLARVKSGQLVIVKVDALPGTTFTGKVESLGPASSVSFSAIAPQNATGNFTKIVQRLPIRIQLDPGQLRLEDLKVGMSVTPQISVE